MIQKKLEFFLVKASNPLWAGFWVPSGLPDIVWVTSEKLVGNEIPQTRQGSPCPCFGTVSLCSGFSFSVWAHLTQSCEPGLSQGGHPSRGCRGAGHWSRGRRGAAAGNRWVWVWQEVWKSMSCCLRGEAAAYKEKRATARSFFSQPLAQPF